ncbi:MAG: hypothetical protein JSR18_12750 [Proteobacteria bacterium]|nr:hypothetical protein [Pseudomonadota bacterium]
MSGIPPAVAAAVAALVLGLLWHWRSVLPCAQPGPRSLHAAPVPRVGGIALVAGAAAGLAFAPPPAGLVGATGATAAAATVAVAAISLVDDWRTVGAAVRLAVHGAAALAVAAVAGNAAGLGAAAIVALALAIAWMANLFNFMDGSDGLALAAAVLGFGALAAAAPASGAAATPYAVVVAAAVPLFIVNRPRATMFIGDVGAVPLGFAAGTAGVAGTLAGAWPPWLPVLAFLPFIADASATLARRIARGERLTDAHKAHYYQRFLQLGAGHAGTLALYAALAAGCSVTAVACARLAPGVGWLALAAWCGVHAIVFAAIDYHWRRARMPP